MIKIGKWIITKDRSDEVISALAYDIGRRMEKIIHERAEIGKTISEENRQLHAKILAWYSKTRDSEFAKFMNLIELKDANNKN